MEHSQQEREAARFHELIACQPTVKHYRRFKVWTLDGITFHVDCTHKDAPALHYAVDHLLKDGIGTRYADAAIPDFMGSHIMFSVKYTPEGGAE